MPMEWDPTLKGRRAMADNLDYFSHARLEYRDGYRHAYLGEVPEPVVYGVQGALRQYYGAKEGPPIASTLDHIVAAVARVECTARCVAPWQGARSRSVDGIGKTIRIKSIHVHYDVAVPPEAR